MRFRVGAPFVALLLLACSGEPAAGPPPVAAGPGEGILFIGNSLTYQNDLPGMVEGLAAAVGQKLPSTQVAFGGYSLEDHLTQGDSLRAIARGGWRVVVLQQGPSGQPDRRVFLRDDTAAFDERIRAVGARTALFSVWADSHGPSTFAQVRESYSLAAADVGGIYLPVNEAWSTAWQLLFTVPLYSSDGFHPSVEGSYLAALVIVGVLAPVSPLGMPATFARRPSGQEVSIAAADASVLQDAAATAIAAYARR